MTEIKPDRLDDHGHDLTPLPLHEQFIKRLIVKLDRPIGRTPCLRHYVGLQESLLAPEVYELAPDVKLGTFPGYQNVRLRHHELQRIIAGDEPSWKDALSSVKGVYVITDLSCGRLYVGSVSIRGRQRAVAALVQLRALESLHRWQSGARADPK
ncbi:hypothetical protein [Microbacterium sp. nov. GSS16]|uniref:hypothetical protein n=1 Tax=Microbacterium sp. nov. GSS16 TaxID=3019890 RepID=UPI00230672FE|nr:hypothetical protein [Microbacterium sp. nov. GSS16]WCD93820.1 hypothetical protein PGB26_05935 [Microbacterium sp. nov. GSS16]